MNNKEQKVETSTEAAIVGNTVLAAGWKELQIEKPLKETEYLLYCEIFEDVFGQEGNTQNFYEVGYWDGRKFNTAYGKDGDDLKENEIKFWSELPCPPACR